MYLGIHLQPSYLLEGFSISQPPPLSSGLTNFFFNPRYSAAVLQVLHLDDQHTIPPKHHQQLAVISHNGSYFVSADKDSTTIMIINFLPCMPIKALVLTGNILLMVGSEMIVARCLTEEGAVDGVLDVKRAGQAESIWTLSQ